MDGILNLNKPAKLTSHDVVLEVRKILKEKRIGHTGTLDPLATGVLVLCVGKATKLVQFLQQESKEYIAEMTLGIRTDTFDRAGRVISEVKCNVDKESVERALSKFKGVINQLPPMISAIKKDGKPLYRLAKQGKEVERQRRKVEIFQLELLDFIKGEHPRARVLVTCSKGTYIRSLINDIGEELGCGAYMSKLIRTRVGALTLEGSVSLEELSKLAQQGKVSKVLTSIEEAISFLPFIRVKAGSEEKILNGQPITINMIKNHSDSFKRGETLRIIDNTGNLLAIGKAEQDMQHKQVEEGRILARSVRVFRN